MVTGWIMRRLEGLKAMAAYENKSEKTLRKLILTESYPAVLIGGEYENDTALVEQWRCRKTAGQCMIPEEAGSAVQVG
jgi:hypothetical protein